MPTTDISPRLAARIAGIGYLIIFVLAIFGNFVVLNGMIDTGDAAATAANIRESEGLFRAGLVAFAIVFLVDVVVAWALYIVFRSLGRDLSLVTAWFRLVYTVLLGVALVFFFIVLEFVGDAGYLAAFDEAQREAQALVALRAFDWTWLIGLLGFGIHLVLLGVLALRSGAVSRALGILLMVAGAAYLIDTLAHAVIGNYEDYADVFLAIVAIPSVVGEMWFAVWLLTRGGKESAAVS